TPDGTARPDIEGPQPDNRGGGPGPGFGPGGPPPRGGRFNGGGFIRRTGPWSPIVVHGELVGDIIANAQPPWEQLGPTLLVGGFALVAIATTSAAALIFG